MLSESLLVAYREFHCYRKLLFLAISGKSWLSEKLLFGHRELVLQVLIGNPARSRVISRRVTKSSHRETNSRAVLSDLEILGNLEFKITNSCWCKWFSSGNQVSYRKQVCASGKNHFWGGHFFSVLPYISMPMKQHIQPGPELTPRALAKNEAGAWQLHLGFLLLCNQLFMST